MGSGAWRRTRPWHRTRPCGKSFWICWGGTGRSGSWCRQLLTAELVELPERFAAFAGRVDEFMVEQQAINARVDARFDRVDDRFDRIDTRLQAITGERQSFYRADLVLEALDDDGATQCVAVDASYTADRRDSNRARRNAGFQTRVTGCPAHTVVAILRNDRDVQALVEAGTVHWLRLTEKDLAPG